MAPHERHPVNRYQYNKALVLYLQQQADQGFDCEQIFLELSESFRYLLHKISGKLVQVRKISYEDAQEEVSSRFFELVVEYDPNKAYFGSYVKRKLTSWAYWEAIKPKDRLTFVEHESLASIDSRTGVSQLETAAVFNSCLQGQNDCVADLLFLRHVVGLTQEELGKIFDVNQFTIGLRLKRVYTKMAKVLNGG